MMGTTTPLPGRIAVRHRLCRPQTRIDVTVALVEQVKTSTCRQAGGRGVYWRVCNVGVSMAMSGRGRVYVVMGWLAGCVREGLQPSYLFSCMREFIRGERGSAKSTLIVEGGYVSHHGSGCCPLLFN